MDNPSWPLVRGREVRLNANSRRVQANGRYPTPRELVGEFDFLGVECRDVVYHPAVIQAQVHPLVAHARLRPGQQLFDPSRFEFDSHRL